MTAGLTYRIHRPIINNDMDIIITLIWCIIGLFLGLVFIFVGIIVMSAFNTIIRKLKEILS